VAISVVPAQNSASFLKWLKSSNQSLSRVLIESKLASPKQTKIWIALLQKSDDAQEILSALTKLNLPLSVIAQFFEATTTLLPENKIEPLKWLGYVQNQVMTIAGEVSTAPAQHHRIASLAKLPGLAQICNNEDQLLQQSAALLNDMFPHASVNIFLNNGNNQLSLPVSIWYDTKSTKNQKDTFLKEILSSENVVQDVLKSQTPQLSPKVKYQTPTAFPDILEEIAAPLIKDQRVIGVLHIMNHAEASYTLADLTFLNAVANELTLLLDAATLQSTVKYHLKEKQILSETNLALNTNYQADNTLDLLARKIAEAMKAGACVITRWDETHQSNTALAEYITLNPKNPTRAWRPLNQPISLEDDIIGKQVWETMRPLALRSKRTHQTAKLATSPWAQYGWRSILVLPIENNGQKLGLIEIYDRSFVRDFNAEDIQLGRALAQQTAIAISQIDLLRQTQQRLTEVSTLFTLSQEIISTPPLHLDKLLDNIVNAVRQMADCRACVIFLIDDSRQYLEIKAAVGIKKQWRNSAKLQIDEGAVGIAISRKETVYIPDTAQDPTFIFFDHSIRSLIAVPLVFQNEIIGAINLDDTKPHMFGPAQERLLTIAANHAAIAIQNSKLFQKAVSEEKRTRAIIEHMADGVLLLNRSGSIITVNPALSKLLNMKTENIIGKNINDVNLDEAIKLLCSPAKKGEAEDTFVTSEVTLPGDNAPTLQIYTNTIYNDHHHKIGEIRVMHDVTQERILEQMKDDFVSTISHELRTPLFSIQGFVRLILSGDVPDEKTQHEFLTIIERQASHLSDLVSNLLDLNRLASDALPIDKVPIQISDTINLTVAKLHSLSRKKGVLIKGKIPTKLPLVLGDPQRLEQVFTNLIGNAIKFTPQKGQVLISAKTTLNSIVISIADTGIGIPPEELDRIFGKFYQVEEHSTRSAEGSGLGLHISRQLISKHQGKIWAKSKIGKGSTFFVELPIAKQEISAKVFL